VVGQVSVRDSDDGVSGVVVVYTFFQFGSLGSQGILMIILLGGFQAQSTFRAMAIISSTVSQ